MAGLLAFNGLATKTKNLAVAGGLSAFVFGVYFYTMRAVGGTDELQVAIDKFEEQKKVEAKSNMGSKA
ncbi:hypothetical protein like AT2G43780 [Hibiscus trionum]|uniref:Cytochrome c oxidase assembly factor 3 mitochondrial coiled-coil domain-containing protein n=1 Tax=Hibiscus trionum TaxID=183268 RepID=A0A9W7ID43_HIBTR|nr:hypothetical protein like AT2G43780 [Hibiscus trionum]